LIEEGYAKTFLPSVFRMLNHEPVSFYADAKPSADLREDIKEENKKANADFVLAPQGDRWAMVDQDQEIPAGSVHVMRLSGAVMKDDWCGVPGTRTLNQQFQEGQANPNIIGTVFSTDTGGGHVDGTFEFVDSLAAAEKPIVGFVDGMSCSAGYAMMSRCKEIVLCHDTAMVGSIGTAISFWNMTKRLEERGIKLVYINATTSPDKNQDYFQALEDNFAPMQEDLDYLNEIFQSSVKAGRPGIKDEAITGKCFRGKKAMSLGMADSIGTLSDAVNRVEELANQ
jgi:protease-4